MVSNGPRRAVLQHRSPYEARRVSCVVCSDDNHGCVPGLSLRENVARRVALEVTRDTPRSLAYLVPLARVERARGTR